MRTLTDAVAVVTGAGSGIGRALALRLAQERCHLALADIDAAGLAAVAAEARSTGVHVSTHTVDVSLRTAMAAFRDAVLKEHGRVELLVNNAGVALIGAVAELSLDEIEWLIGVNFWGVVHGVKLFLPVLQQQNEAHIVNLSSIFGIIAPPGRAPIAPANSPCAASARRCATSSRRAAARSRSRPCIPAASARRSPPMRAPPSASATRGAAN